MTFASGCNTSLCPVHLLYGLESSCYEYTGYGETFSDVKHTVESYKNDLSRRLHVCSIETESTYGANVIDTLRAYIKSEGYQLLCDIYFSKITNCPVTTITLVYIELAPSEYDKEQKAIIELKKLLSHIPKICSE